LREPIRQEFWLRLVCTLQVVGNSLTFLGFATDLDTGAEEAGSDGTSNFFNLSLRPEAVRFTEVSI